MTTPIIANVFKHTLLGSLQDFYYGSGTVLKGALFDSSFSPNADMDWDGISEDEITGPGYPTGGIELTGLIFLGTPSRNLDAEDLIFPAVTLVNVKFVVLYLINPTPSNILMGIWPLVEAQSPNNTDFEIKWNVNGIIEIV